MRNCNGLHPGGAVGNGVLSGQLMGPYPKSSGPAAVQYYFLRALGPRVVEGTMVADTDRGWFTWSQSAVALTRATYTSTHATFRTRWVVADSPQMVVQFPEPVSVRHAWVTTAQTHGEANFNWDSFGEVACDPPPFGAPAGAKELGSTNRDQAAGDPTPAPAPPPAFAAPTSPPFPIPTCDHPFVAATVTKVVQPDYPQSMKEDAWNVTGISEVYVAIDPHGNLTDAWIFASSGYVEFDREAIRAARHSKYSPAVSYCRPVSGTYVFRADFGPY